MTAAITKINCQNVGYELSGNDLLSAISCEFSAGEISVLLGKNGAGKSSLLKLISKQEPNFSGDISFDKTSINQISFAQMANGRAVLTQQSHLAFSMNVEDLVEIGASVQAQFTPAMLAEILALCDLTHLATRDVLSLSGGELQRAQIARVLAQIWPQNGLSLALSQTQSKPQTQTSEAELVSETSAFKGKWLMLDEWSNNLDLHHHQLFAKLFKQLASQGLGIIMVLHDLNLAVSLADNVKVLDSGKLVLDGEPKGVLTAENLKQYLALDVILEPTNINQENASSYHLYLP